MANLLKNMLVSTLVYVSVSAHAELVDPFSVPLFKIPKEVTVVDDDYRRNWTRLTGFELSSLHWNQFVITYGAKGNKEYRNNYLEYLRVYQNEDDEDIEEEDIQFYTYPVGTVFVKENYSSQDGIPKEPVTLTAMIKREAGFDPELGDWEFMQSLPNGQVIASGKGSDPAIRATCGGCHQGVAERDYVFASYFSKNKKN